MLVGDLGFFFAKISTSICFSLRVVSLRQIRGPQKTTSKKYMKLIVKLNWQAEKRFKVGDKVGVDPNRFTNT